MCPPFALGLARARQRLSLRTPVAPTPARPGPTAESTDSEVPSYPDTMVYLVCGWASVYGRATRCTVPTYAIFTAGAGVSRRRFAELRKPSARYRHDRCLNRRVAF